MIRSVLGYILRFSGFTTTSTFSFSSLDGYFLAVETRFAWLPYDFVLECILSFFFDADREFFFDAVADPLWRDCLLSAERESLMILGLRVASRVCASVLRSIFSVIYTPKLPLASSKVANYLFDYDCSSPINEL